MANEIFLRCGTPHSGYLIRCLAYVFERRNLRWTRTRWGRSGFYVYFVGDSAALRRVWDMYLKAMRKYYTQGRALDALKAKYRIPF